MASQSKSAPELVAELRQLVVEYAKQETVDPLRSLGRYLGWGVAGAVLLSIGGVFLTVGLLRVLQNETGTWFDGNWSVVPYLITLVFVAVVIALAVWRVMRTKSREMGRPQDRPREVENRA